MKETRSYRLTRLVDLRERQTEHCRRLLAAATEAVLMCEAAMQRIHFETLQLNDEWHSMAGHGVSAAHALQFQQATAGLLQRLNAASLGLVSARKSEVEARTNLEEALKKQKAVEKLRARNREREALEAQRHEQAQLDEFAVLRSAQEVNG